ncbi:Hpt domain-containing protein [Arthrobacter oryzae]|uniref:Hpt domain-containing protein n=1 Tax=Arthrobacter oryzae TaxID=409290 RepID=A0A495EUC1_9MICC|nr:Hpt domain-containing protein [Arthrobacter oryzae]RKR20568.1 Hpt domain-containing protein [Arthrobacter oryzae]
MSLPSACPDDGNASIGLASTAPVGLPAQAAAATAALASCAAAPLVDPAALQDLGAQLDSPAVAKGFARDYTKMWDQRYRSLASALERGDLAGSMDAVLSLKTSSAMVGGLRLAQLAGELEDAIRAGDIDRALSLLCDVAERGGETVDELQYSYVLWES